VSNMNPDGLDCMEEISIGDDFAFDRHGAKLQEEIVKAYVVRAEEVDNTIQELLAEQLTSLTTFVSAAFEKAMLATKSKMETMRRMELEAIRLRWENQRLRAQIVGAGLSVDFQNGDGNPPVSYRIGNGSAPHIKQRNVGTPQAPNRSHTPPSSKVWPLHVPSRPSTPSTRVTEPQGSLMGMPEGRHSSVRSFYGEEEISQTQVVEFKRQTSKPSKHGQVRTLRGTALAVEVCTSPKAPWAMKRFAQRQATYITDGAVTRSLESSGEPRSSANTSVVRFKSIGRTAFVDADEMKQRVRDAIGKKDYNVKRLYHTTGVFQSIAKSAFFDYVTLSVIALNSIWLGFETDMNTASSLADADLGFQIIENMFCIFFLFEWVIRFGAFRHKCDGFRDRWFLFDSLLMCAMILDTWVFTLYVACSSQQVTSAFNPSVLKVLKMARLTRMARVAKLVRANPELLCLLKGMMVACRSVSFTLALLVLVLYVFGIAFTQLTKNTPVGTRYYKTVPDAIVTLTLHGIFLEGLPDVVIMTGNEHLLLGALLMLFVLVASVTVMNMLTGLLVRVVSVVSQVEKEAMVIGYIKNLLQEQLQMTYCSGDDDQDKGLITRERFEFLLTNRQSALALAEVGVDVESLVDLLDFIFQGELSLSFAKVIEIVLDLRGNKMASVKDIVDLRNYMTQEIASGLACIEASICQMINQHGPLSSGNKQWHRASFNGDAVEV